MGKSLKVALALGVGYFLGRTHKTRLALLLAAGAATGGFGGVARRVVTSGGKRLAASESLGKLSPDFGQVVDSLKGDLADAGKAAAKAAVTSRLDSVADSLHDRTEALRSQAAPDLAAAGRRAGVSTEEGGPGDRSADRDRPRRPPSPRPGDDSYAARPRSSDRDRPRERRPASSRASRPASGRRSGGD